jgi:hypothetical protein
MSEATDNTIGACTAGLPSINCSMESSRRINSFEHIIQCRVRNEVHLFVLLALFVLSALFLSACKPADGELQRTPLNTSTAEFVSTLPPTPRPIKTATSTQTPVPSSVPSPTSTATPNLYQFNGYWLSPIEEGTGAYIQTYGNLCPEYFDGSNLYCIENWMGEKGQWPEDYWEVLVCPHHVVEWDIAWDHWGEKVFAVQGGQVKSIELEDNSTYGVHFFIVDQQNYGANYGHVDGRSLVENGIINQEQFENVQIGQSVDGAMVYEGQQLGITGDDCCPNGVLHIGPVYRFWGIADNGEYFYTEPSELWQLGEWPDVADFRPVEAGNPCPNPEAYHVYEWWNSGTR